jgi:2-polyprenyl-3-methyl-5-hydroxy-6-metoxy-1,4-benzoquinol methylase
MDLQDKWNRFYSQPNLNTEPAPILVENNFLLPKQGIALDLACGLGNNARYMAKVGLTVDAWDISDIALENLNQQIATTKLNIDTKQCKIDSDSLPHNHYDVVVICRFLDRNLCNAIMASLKSGGLLLYQTYTRSKLDKIGPNNPDFLLETNELLQLFAPLTVIFYREYAKIGDLLCGERNEAYFIGQKPLPELI